MINKVFVNRWGVHVYDGEQLGWQSQPATGSFQQAVVNSFQGTSVGLFDTRTLSIVARRKAMPYVIVIALPSFLGTNLATFDVQILYRIKVLDVDGPRLFLLLSNLISASLARSKGYKQARPSSAIRVGYKAVSQYCRSFDHFGPSHLCRGSYPLSS